LWAQGNSKTRLIASVFCDRPHFLSKAHHP
jgi:hypothetical protein